MKLVREFVWFLTGNSVGLW